MILETSHDPRLANLLRGASIILAVEPDMQLSVALQRSKEVEGISKSEFEDAMHLIMRIAKELGLNGESGLDREQARAVLRHMLKDPPWNRISDKHDGL